MLSVSSDPLSSIDSTEQLSYFNGYQFDGFGTAAAAECHDNSFWVSSDISSDSPNSTVSADTWSSPPVKDETAASRAGVKQEQSLPDGAAVRIVPLPGSDSFHNDDGYKQVSMSTLCNPAYPPPPQQQSPQPYLQQPYPQNADVRAETVSGEGRNNVVCQVTPVDDEIPSRVEKRLRPDSTPSPRRRSYKRQKISGENLAGSPPLPPDIEPPAILGGSLPPRVFKSSAKRKRVFTERELKSRRKRGLSDDSDSESEERRLVRLPRRSLLTITTSQMSQFVSFLRSTMKLTPSQLDELSKQKRLVKNRECACRFRAKKELTTIEYCERVMDLENDVEALRAENERLRQLLRDYSVPYELLQQQQVPQQQEQKESVVDPQ